MHLLISRPMMLGRRVLPAGLTLDLEEIEARPLIAMGAAVALSEAAPSPRRDDGSNGPSPSVKARRKAG
ncbi:MAG: hypothetical protein AB1768_15340 [Pseudomonadota bacterium]|jgi:hypothetical protein